MNIFFQEGFKDDMRALRKEDLKLVYKVVEIIFDIQQNPFEGIGKPEPLKGRNYQGCWSRRIDQKHRLIYKVEKETATLLACYGHYDD